MAQGLNAGDQFNAQSGGAAVQLPQLRHGVAPPHVAEVGLVRHLIGVLGVHHPHVHAHQGHPAQQCFQGFRPEHRIAGNVKHHPGFKAGRFFPQPFLPVPAVPQQGQRPVQMNRLFPAQPDFSSPLLRRRARAPEYLHGDSVFTGGKSNQRTYLLHGLPKALRQHAGKSKTLDLSHPRMTSSFTAGMHCPCPGIAQLWNVCEGWRQDSVHPPFPPASPLQPMPWFLRGQCKKPPRPGTRPERSE